VGRKREIIRDDGAEAAGEESSGERAAKRPRQEAGGVGSISDGETSGQ
jgi:hypothetical protein